MYKGIRDKMREGSEDGKVKYLEKEEIMNIFKKVDVWEVRNNVMELFGYGNLNEPAHKTLSKAQIFFLSEQSPENG